MKALLLGAALLLGRARRWRRAQRPDTVFFEDLTFDEIRDAIACRHDRTSSSPTGGVEDGGARHRHRQRRPTSSPTRPTALRAPVGQTFVAPVIAYAPGGVMPVPAEGSRSCSRRRPPA